MSKLLFASLLLVSLFILCPAPGVDRSGEEQIDRIYGDIDGLDPVKARNKEFFRYILRVVKVLDRDEAFKKRSGSLDNESINQGKLTNGLYSELSTETKGQLDRLKVAEVEFQEKLLAADKTHMLEKEGNEWNPIHQTDKSSFSQKDLDLLLGRYQALVAIKDAKRREDFNKHEMDKELKYRESLEKASTDEERKTLEEKQKKTHEKKHEPLHKPMGGAQLREVWQKKEGLDPEYFDLKTLFRMHDKNGDGYLDVYELETLFLADLDKAYDPEDPDIDNEERDEELERMREVAMKEVDTDKDGKVSLDEVLAAKKREDFDEDEEYHPLFETGKEFTEEELSEYKEELKKGKEGV